MEGAPPSMIRSILEDFEVDSAMDVIWRKLEEVASADTATGCGQSQHNINIIPLKEQINGIHLEFIELITMAAGQMANRVREVGLIQAD